MKKQIVSQTREFQPSYDDELLLDDTPRVNSFNGVTSDGVARAIAGASGEVPAVTESDNGKVLKAIYDEGGPAVEWGEVETGATYTGGNGIEIDSGNAVNVIAGQGIEIGGSSIENNVEVYIEDWPVDDGKLYHFGKLDANISVEALTAGIVDIRLMQSYRTDTDTGTFYPAICAADPNDPNSFDVTQRLVLGGSPISSWEQEYIPVDFTFSINVNIINTTESTITLQDVLADPSLFVLTMIQADSQTYELDLEHKFYMQGEAKAQVNTIGLMSYVANGVCVKNPVPDNTENSDKILISHGTGFLPQWGELESGRGTEADGLRVNVRPGKGLEIGGGNELDVKAGSGLIIGQDTVHGVWRVYVDSESWTDVDYLARMAANARGTYGYDGIALADAINLQGSMKVTIGQSYNYNGSNDLGIVCVAVVAKDPNNPYGIDISSRLFYSGDFMTGLTGSVPIGTELWFNAIEADSEGLSTITWQDVVDAPDNYVLALLAGDGLGGIDTTAKYTAQLISSSGDTLWGDYYEGNFLKMQYPIPEVIGQAGKVLSVNSGATGLEWVSKPTVDQTYNGSSANAQSGVAVAEAVGGVLPSITGNASKVLAVNSGATGLEWVSAGGGGSDTIAPYTLRFKFLDTSFDPSTSITGTYGTWTRVSSDPNIWDWTNASWSWEQCFRNKSFSYNGSALIGSGDLSGVTSMKGMFKNVSNLAYVKMGKFGSTCDFTEMFSIVEYNLQYVELGESSDICYGSMTGMFAQDGTYYIKHYTLKVIFNGVLAATNMSRFAIYNRGLVEAPRINTQLSISHYCNNFSQAFEDCENLKLVPQYYVGTNSTDWNQAFSGCKSLIAAPDINLAYATITYKMFSGCESLSYVPDYDVSSATSVEGMFSGCRSLTKIPNLTGLDNKSSVNQLFEDCYGIQTGADTLYQQLSTQATPPTSTTDTFKNCGAATVTGSAALATIPSAWGGTGA